jgi:hypothetical protein
MRRRRHLCLAAATLTLLTAGAAQAAPPHELRTNSGTEPEAAQAESDSGGGLPFSGLDLALLFAGGGPLLLIGAGLRRRRPKPSMQPAQEETLTLA